MSKQTIAGLGLQCQACQKITPAEVPALAPDVSRLDCKWCGSPLATFALSMVPDYRERQIVLTDQGMVDFLAMLDAPGRPSAELIALMTPDADRIAASHTQALARAGDDETSRALGECFNTLQDLYVRLLQAGYGPPESTPKDEANLWDHDRALDSVFADVERLRAAVIESAAMHETCAKALEFAASRERSIGDLACAVEGMREQQRAWFGGDKSPTTLALAKEAERRVDRLLKQHRAEAVQPSLFGGGR